MGNAECSQSCTAPTQESIDDMLPNVLFVDSPNGQQGCTGKYALVEGEVPNGMPLWKKEASPEMRLGEKFIYSSRRGTWNIGGEKAHKKKFQGYEAHIFHQKPHYGEVMPHQQTGPWHIVNQSQVFVEDIEVTVTAMFETQMYPTVPMDAITRACSLCVPRDGFGRDERDILADDGMETPPMDAEPTGRQSRSSSRPGAKAKAKAKAASARAAKVAKRETASMQDADVEPPPVLYVVSPNGQQACAGKFFLVPRLMPNGYPLWRKADSDKAREKFLYTSTKGTWNIGGQMAKSKHFKCHQAHIFQSAPHEGVLPHELDGIWQRGSDDGLFVDDFDITVSTEMPPWTTFLPACVPSAALLSLMPRSHRGRSGSAPPVLLSARDSDPEATVEHFAPSTLSLSPRGRRSEQNWGSDEDDDIEVSFEEAQHPDHLRDDSYSTQDSMHMAPQYVKPKEYKPFMRYCIRDQEQDCDPIYEVRKTRAYSRSGSSMPSGTVTPMELRRRLLRVLADREATDDLSTRLSSKCQSRDSSYSGFSSRNKVYMRDYKRYNHGARLPLHLEEPALVLGTPLKGRAFSEPPRRHNLKQQQHHACDLGVPVRGRSISQNVRTGEFMPSVRLSFWPSIDQRGAEVTFNFTERPLGMLFDKSNVPIVIKNFAPGSAGLSFGMRPGMVLAAIDGVDATKGSYEQVFALLDAKCKALPTASECDR